MLALSFIRHFDNKVSDEKTGKVSTRINGMQNLRLISI